MQTQTVILFTVGAVLLHSTVAEVFLKEAPHVKLTNQAVLSGTTELSRDGNPFSSFFGIPYATVPQRFAEAELISEPKWSGVKAAIDRASLCVQAPISIPDLTQTVPVYGSEDCLTLNVFVPAKASKELLPVMVFIHGGAFLVGGAASHGPEYFMDEEVILVTINYRLNVFGFLSTGDDVIPGNNGLKDQVVALKWVQKFIKTFGGDPQKVTVFGESAGAASVHLLTLSPLTTGLFHRAIAQSGSGLAPWALRPNARVKAVKLANFLNCPTTASQPSEITSYEILNCLRNETVETLTNAAFKFGPRWPSFFFPTHFGPVLESNSVAAPFITENPWNTIRDNSLKKIPLMTGVTSDEGASLFAGPILQFPELVAALDKNWNIIFPVAFEFDRFIESKQEQEIIADKIKKFYFGDKPVSAETRQSLVNIYSDYLFVHSTRKLASEMTLRGENTYLYKFAQETPGSLLKLNGLPMAEEEAKKTGHGDEMLIQFKNNIPGAELSPEQEEFSKNYIKLWVSFAKHGKPAHSWGKSKSSWEPLSKKEVNENNLTWFELHSNPSHVPETEEFKERMTFWDNLFNTHFPELYPTKQQKRTEL